MDEDLIEFPDIGFMSSSKPLIFAVIVGILAFIRAHMRGASCPSQDKLNGKTVLITGGNSGIGLETARECAKRGARVIIACRDEAKAKQACDDLYESVKTINIVSMKLDLSSFHSVREFASEFCRKEKKLDVLINNAGVMMHPQKLTSDGFDYQLQSNYLGHFLLTHLLLDILKSSAPARIINLAATSYRLNPTINFDDINMEKGPYVTGNAFSQSKLCLVLFTKTLSEKLAGSGITVNCVHPGVVRTNVHRYMPFRSNAFLKFSLAPLIWLLMKTPKDGAQTSIFCTVASELEEQTGKYFAECAEELFAPNALDDEIANKLYDQSLNWTGLNN